MNKKGSILMISLWIVAMLALFAVGLGHRASINLRLARYQRDRLKAYYLGKAGVQKAIAELEKDQNGYDSLNETWSTGCDPTGKSLFENVEIKPGSGETFTVRYLYDKDRNIYLCMADEERKININSASQPLLLTLLKESGIEEAQAQELVNYIRIWRGDNNPELKANDDLYRDFKKAPFTHPEELIIVLEIFYKDKSEADCRAKGQEVFNRLRDLFTVYGDKTNATLNINTVSLKILTILVVSIAQNEDQKNNVSKLVQDIMNLREEKKYFEKIEDIQINVIPGPRETLFNNLKEKLVFKSDYFKIETIGNVGQVAKKITAIYHKAHKEIVYWHEN